jgi:beta-galactosidase
MWAQDARRMRELGLTRVRIGEFSWSRVEPEPGQFDWVWLDRAIETLNAEGLGIILGTPTATPPKWLVDQMPDMIAIDTAGRPRRFGSRRHYCFSHSGYRAEAARITRAYAERFGQNPAVVAWQTDNEYGCHDTSLSYSSAALTAFRSWLGTRYGTIKTLNESWGAAFWSQTYRTFDEIDLPNLTVTEANPAHLLDFRRFSSEQVVSFNHLQTDILRELSPGRDITHNFMGFYTEFDHHAVSRDLDVASWDSYPLGFLEQFWFSPADKDAYARQGHPDVAAFHHDLYRGCSPGGRWWVMEQQPGPVNWARYNPAPLPGMVRLWTHEAFAHGAELVSFFRWRQYPKAQEQMHTGLLRPDDSEDAAVAEIRQLTADLQSLNPEGIPSRRAALIFSYEADWMTAIQPQGAGYSALRCTFEMYSALRHLGIDVDIIPPEANFDGYRLLVLPCLPVLPESLTDRLAAFGGPVIIGPRAGSKTEHFAIPDGLPPGPLGKLLRMRVTRVESLRPGIRMEGEGWSLVNWFEHLETESEAELSLKDGRPALIRQGPLRYFAGWPGSDLLQTVLFVAASEAGLAPVLLPPGLRVRRRGQYLWAFNYGQEPAEIPGALAGKPVIGTRRLAPAGVAVLET